MFGVSLTLICWSFEIKFIGGLQFDSTNQISGTELPVYLHYSLLFPCGSRTIPTTCDTKIFMISQFKGENPIWHLWKPPEFPRQFAYSCGPIYDLSNWGLVIDTVVASVTSVACTVSTLGRNHTVTLIFVWKQYHHFFSQNIFLVLY